jgi:uncharacterized membrane protein YheB (UPF0754 family)
MTQHNQALEDVAIMRQQHDEATTISVVRHEGSVSHQLAALLNKDTLDELSSQLSQCLPDLTVDHQ